MNLDWYLFLHSFQAYVFKCVFCENILFVNYSQDWDIPITLKELLFYLIKAYILFLQMFLREYKKYLYMLLLNVFKILMFKLNFVFKHLYKHFLFLNFCIFCFKLFEIILWKYCCTIVHLFNLDVFFNWSCYLFFILLTIEPNLKKIFVQSGYRIILIILPKVLKRTFKVISLKQAKYLK